MDPRDDRPFGGPDGAPRDRPPVAWPSYPGQPPALPPAAAPTPPVAWRTPEPKHRREVPDAPGFVLAGVPARIVAYLIDGVILGLIGAILGIVGGGVFGFEELDPRWSPLRQPPIDQVLVPELTPALFVFGVVGLGISLAYFTLSWTSQARATLGQRILEIQVGHAGDGRQLTTREALVRVLALGVVFEIAYLLPIREVAVPLAAGAYLWGPILIVTTLANWHRMGLHDRLAGSWVVQPADRTHDTLAYGCLLLIGLAIAVGVLWSLAALGAS